MKSLKEYTPRPLLLQSVRRENDSVSQQPKTLSVREAAQQLGYTLSYLYVLLACGRLEAEKVGKQWRVSAEAVNARIERRSAK